jgi:hypothetical protein
MKVDQHAIIFAMPPATTPSFSRILWQKMLFLGALATVICTLPYLVPVNPTISVSYLVGFSNRTATALFILGAAAFAWFTRGDIGKVDERDSHLSVRILLAAIVSCVVVCLVRRYISFHSQPGGEAPYFINRTQLLVAGLIPYRQFEFIYGPLLLYPPLWITQIFGTDPITGYYISWTVEWVVGTVLLWFALRFIDGPVTGRNWIFFYFFSLQLTSLRDEGMNYTPFRAFIGAFLIVSVWKVWQTSRSVWITVLISILATGLGLASSPEHGISVAIGLGGGMLLVRIKKQRFPMIAVLAFFAGSSICMVIADHFGLFQTLRSFASGGYQFPLMPSPSVLLILFVYIVSACVLFTALENKQDVPVVVPLVLAGFVLLPSAMGRCDIGHLQLATPAYMVGIVAIFSRPALRKIWLPLALIGLFVLPILSIYRSDRASRRITIQNTRLQASTKSPMPEGPAYVKLEDLPCDRTYQMINTYPSLTHSIRPACVDTGYYFSMGSVMAEQDVDRKIAELAKHPERALVLLDGNLAANFPAPEASPGVVRQLELSVFIPRARNHPVTLERIRDYIQTHYEPGPVLADNQRIWYPFAKK